MPLAAGLRLGPYEILGLLGSGGMGEVYRARDTRLGRIVAIKTLPSASVDDLDRERRFEREARTIAALAHPNICMLLDVGEQHGVRFLVLEHLDGETLAARLDRGRLPARAALDLAIQILEALDAAHRRGIVHRDLKPANVMLTSSGLKLLDFGLARLVEPALPTDATASMDVTQAGQVLGTPRYMAPEQLDGRRADARTDLFAFGLIAYEMLAGRRPFDALSPSGIPGAASSDPKPLHEEVPGLPAPLSSCIRHCLARDPDCRWSSARDVLLQLRGIDLDEGRASPDSGRAVPGRERRLWVAVLATVLLILGIISIRGWMRDTDPTDLDLLMVLPPEETPQASTDSPQISPDGRHVAFVATDASGSTSLWVYSLDRPPARPLADTAGATMPFWSPDSSGLGFFADGRLKTVSLAGGTALSLASAPVPRGGTWGSDDKILFIAQPPAPPLLVPVGGGAAIPVPVPNDFLFRVFPQFLPDGRHYIFMGRRSLDAPFVIGVAALDSDQTEDLVPSTTSGIYAAPGYLLYRRDGAATAQAFDASTRRLSGQPITLPLDVGFNPITYQAFFSASNQGRLASQAATGAAELAWYDRQGVKVGLLDAEGGYNALCTTADDGWLVYERADIQSGNVDLWIRGLTGGPPSRLTFHPAVDFYPVCKPNGSAVYFSSLREGRPNLFRVDPAAPGRETAVLRSPQAKVATDISADDSTLIFSRLESVTQWDVAAVDMAEGVVQALVSHEGEQRNARLSPDGRWLVYASNESGRFEVFVEPYPPTGARWQISTSGGHQPQWRRDGKELFYATRTAGLVAVEVSARGPTFEWSEPTTVVRTRLSGWERDSQGCQYAASADGGRFLVSTTPERVQPIHVALNWTAALDREKRPSTAP